MKYFIRPISSFIYFFLYFFGLLSNLVFINISKCENMKKKDCRKKKEQKNF